MRQDAADAGCCRFEICFGYLRSRDRGRGNVSQFASSRHPSHNARGGLQISSVLLVLSKCESSPYWMRCWVVAFPVAPCRRCFRGRHPSHNADTKRSKYGKSCSRACTGPRACQLAHRSVIFTTDNIFSLKARITRTCQLLAATTRRHSRVHRRTQQRTPDTLIQWHQHTRAPTDTRQLTHRQYTHRRAHLTTLDSHHTCALYSYKAHAYVRANF